MKLLNLAQGSPEWLAHRATCWNASEAAMMLGVSPYLTRSALVKWRATGIAPEYDDATLRAFAEGHRAEALARPLAETMLGEDLYPCVGVIDGTKYSASLDGITLDGKTVFEHKLLNEELREAIRPNNSIMAIPEFHRIQMEHQCLVSGAERVLFMASEWDRDGDLIEERHCWYYPDADLRARIVAGWAQFDADVDAYVPQETRPAAVAAVVEGFGALSLRVEGRVLASNLDAFRADADAFISRLPKPAELETDQDFADADAAVKACAEAETRIKAAKDSALAQMADVDAVLRTADAIAETIRIARLALDKAVKAEKDRRKSEIVAAGVDAVRAHYATINATLGEHAILAPQSLTIDIGGAIKNLRTLSSITDAVNAAVAGAKIAASQRAEAVRASIAAMAEASAGHETLFADRVQLCATKAPDDIRNLAAARIFEHKRLEAAREVATEVQKFDAQQKPESVAQQVEQLPSKQTVAGSTPAGLSNARIRLGEINARIAPLSITADGLAQLGFTAVGTDRAAKLYVASDWPAICDALISRITAAAVARAA